MKILFYILSLIVIVTAAVFSVQNRGKLEDQVAFKKDRIEKNRSVNAQISKTEKELSDEEDRLTEAQKARAEVEQSIASLESKERELRRELSEIEADLEVKDEKIKQTEAALAELKKVFVELGFDGDVDMDSIERNMKTLEDRKKVLTAEIAELETNIEGAESTIAKNRAEIARLGERKAERDARIRSNARESVITAVDSDWGFVVIGAGRSTGFEPQTNLIVKRAGRVIAEVKPSSIEQSQTIAEIDFDTVAPGVVLQPGDRVMLVKPLAN
ncbi:hypothetical protein [Haloferula sp. A504]|uniref:hypothetical protein n=1 Tax=Haloferula sp. A504 TaxID=3373601 RepID=UPI0031BDAF73|nr:hypothetical protein [Verrucomicrobiaceae bacterium E54]